MNQTLVWSYYSHCIRLCLHHCYCVFVFALLAYLLLGLVFVLVMMETCWELPHLRRLRQNFYHENVRELDSETTQIIDRDMSEQATEPSDHVRDHLPVIPSVSEQAASLRHDGKSVPYTPASGSAVNKKTLWEIVPYVAAQDTHLLATAHLNVHVMYEYTVEVVRPCLSVYLNLSWVT